MTLDIAQENDSASTLAAIEKGLNAYNIAMAGDYNGQSLVLSGKDASGQVQAGLKGRSFYGWLFIDWLWVAEAFRGQDYGTRLLQSAEDVARQRGCTGVFLDTHSFQAPGFYKKQGYTEFGRLENFPPGHARIYFSKTF